MIKGCAAVLRQVSALLAELHTGPLKTDASHIGASEHLNMHFHLCVRTALKMTFSEVPSDREGKYH